MQIDEALATPDVEYDQTSPPEDVCCRDVGGPQLSSKASDRNPIHPFITEVSRVRIESPHPANDQAAAVPETSATIIEL